MLRRIPHNLQVLAFEDGPFTSPQGLKATRAVVLGVLMRGSQIRRLLTGWVQVDGIDATDRMLQMAQPFSKGLAAIMFHGLPHAGFNVVDAKRLSRELDRPVLTVLGVKPRREAVEAALRKHFVDWEYRLSILDAVGPPLPFETSHGSVSYYQAVGINGESAEALIRSLTVFGKVPEPLRTARLLADVFPT